MNEKNGINKGLNTLGTVVSTATLIAVIIWNQSTSHDRQITSLEAAQNKTVTALADRVKDLEAQTLKGVTDHATHTATFIEVETQFKWLREVIERDIKHHEKLLDQRGAWIMEHEREGTRTNAEQWERIKSLERITFPKDRGP